MGLMPVNDSMFMIAESREQPMHVGSLQLFDLPAGAGKDYLTELYRDAVSVKEVNPVYRKRAHRGPLTAGQWAWQDDRDIDLEHHVRHSALAGPGRVRELLALTSRLHGTLLDRHRPLWEAHLIEGLEGDRFAVYTKLHHAVMDGVSGLKLLQRSLSTDPDDRDVPVPWGVVTPRRRKAKGSGAGLLDVPKAAAALTVDVVGLTPRLLHLAGDALRSQAVALPGQAPRSMLNVSITGSRRFAAESWSLERIRAVGRSTGATVNDVVLAMCSGALRQYLSELDALPATSLVAMTPVSLRKDLDDDQSSNATGTILCRLGTDLADPEARLAAVKSSMDAGKAALKGLNQTQVTALSAVVMAPLLFNSLVSLHRVASPPFNLVISNVPGPQDPLYWNGARMQGLYPLSIPTHGQALNITVTSYAGEVQFGLVGDRRSVPRLQRLLGHLEDSLAGLEKAVG
ncbi:MAG: diacylglycerol O-acyltransferase [Frankiales bacterium]|nr:diacylglycerol O-acyltransferase [Frankiales bacterium]